MAFPPLKTFVCFLFLLPILQTAPNTPAFVYLFSGIVLKPVGFPLFYVKCSIFYSSNKIHVRLTALVQGRTIDIWFCSTHCGLVSVNFGNCIFQTEVENTRVNLGKAKPEQGTVGLLLGPAAWRHSSAVPVLQLQGCPTAKGLGLCQQGLSVGLWLQ